MIFAHAWKIAGLVGLALLAIPVARADDAEIPANGICRPLRVRAAGNRFELSLLTDEQHAKLPPHVPPAVVGRIALDIEGLGRLAEVTTVDDNTKNPVPSDLVEGDLFPIEYIGTFANMRLTTIVNTLNGGHKRSITLRPRDNTYGKFQIRSAMLMMWYPGPTNNADPPSLAQGATRVLAFSPEKDNEYNLTRPPGSNPVMKLPVPARDYFGRLLLDFDKPQDVDHVEFKNKIRSRLDGSVSRSPFAVEFSYEEQQDDGPLVELIKMLNENGAVIKVVPKQGMPSAQLRGAVLCLWGCGTMDLLDLASVGGEDWSLNGVQAISEWDYVDVLKMNNRDFTVERNSASIAFAAKNPKRARNLEPNAEKSIKTLLAHSPDATPLTIAGSGRRNAKDGKIKLVINSTDPPPI